MEFVERADWKPDQSAISCNYCQSNFTIIRRRHHCRKCGGIFCDPCSSNYSILPAEYGYSGQQRLCKGCFNTFEQKRIFYENDALAIQFQMRSTSTFEFVKNLPDIGHPKHGLRKSYCLAKSTDGKGEEVIVSIITPTMCPWPMNNEKKKKKFEKTVTALKHPHVMPPVKIEVCGSNEKILVIRPYSKQGSLRDVIYKCKPTSPWDTKYVFNAKKSNQTGVSSKLFQKYSRQIIEGLLYLKNKGLQHCHLHTSNILVNSDNNCVLVEVENNLLGMKPYYHEYHSTVKENLEVLAFGHVLFEMIVGIPLGEPSNINNYIPLYPEKVFLILQQIFSLSGTSTTSNGSPPPTLEELAKNSYFELPAVNLTAKDPPDHGKVKKSQLAFIKEFSYNNQTKSTLTSSTSNNNLYKSSNNATPALKKQVSSSTFTETGVASTSSSTLSTADKRKSVKLTSSTDLNKQFKGGSPPTPQSPAASTPSITSAPSTPPTKSPLPPPPPPPPSLKANTPPPSTGRNALLDSIRNPNNFKNLKKSSPTKKKSTIKK
ncbi:hypothetical protein CYY_003253 [Polysphondylium violaceum]|uniref:FVYE domain-containing protein n=1 Tax=Polysphondylium violaceum TaxID=133409 RepID=A0A8J4PYR4_9MYCE|nr:hypothetical protein CYY_003253 [Polysphondylium violaceum]